VPDANQKSVNYKTLHDFDAILFYGIGELELTDQQKADVLSFIKEDGKGFVGVHTAITAFYEWPEYGEMIGGYFDDHPWTILDAPVIVEDPSFPAMKAFPKAFSARDEIYQVRNFSRDRVRVLARLDPAKLDLRNPRVHRTDNDFAVAWARSYGRGRVFYSTFGHTEESWDDPAMQTMWVEAIKWAMGLTNADVTRARHPSNTATSIGNDLRGYCSVTVNLLFTQGYGASIDRLSGVLVHHWRAPGEFDNVS